MNLSTVNKPARPAFKIHGGKWRSGKWIISHFPEEHDVYVEPFCGSASVLLQKPRSRIEIINDLDGNIYNFFTILREQAYNLLYAINFTPYHHLEYIKCWEDVEDPVEQARRFYVRSLLSIMGPTVQWQNGFRRQKKFSRGKYSNQSMKPAAISFSETTHLHVVAERLLGVTIEQMDALDLIKLYDSPDTLFYIDPPYLGSTRAQRSKDAYLFDMSSDESHVALLTLLKGLQGMALISGYKSDLYSNLLTEPDWLCFHKSSRTNGKNARVEHLWANEQLYSKLSGDLK